MLTNGEIIKNDEGKRLEGTFLGYSLTHVEEDEI